MKKVKLNTLEKDILIETASICSGNISTVLSNLIGKQVDLKVSETDILPVEIIPQLIAKGEKLVIAPNQMIVEIYANLTGDFEGNILTMFPKDNTFKLLDMINKKKIGTTKLLEEKELLVLKGLGDTILSIYTKQISDFLGIKIKSGQSRVITTFGANLMDFALAGVHESYDNVMLLRTDFSTMDEVRGSFIVIFALESIDDFLKIIRKKTS